MGFPRHSSLAGFIFMPVGFGFNGLMAMQASKEGEGRAVLCERVELVWNLRNA